MELGPKVSEQTIDKYFSTLPSDWTSAPVERKMEGNAARLFYDLCRKENVMGNFTNPDHFEYFLGTNVGKEFIHFRERFNIICPI